MGPTFVEIKFLGQDIALKETSENRFVVLSRVFPVIQHVFELLQRSILVVVEIIRNGNSLNPFQTDDVCQF